MLDATLEVLHFDKDHPLTMDIPDLDQSVFHQTASEKKVFSIRHEGDYLSRYKILGDPHCYVMTKDGEYAASILCVKRTIAGQICWYLDDVKIVPHLRGKYTLQAINYFRQVFRETVQDSPFFFAVIAAEGNQRDAALVKFYEMAFGTSIPEIACLHDFTLSWETFKKAQHLIEKHRGPIQGYLSLAGLRDFSVNDTNQAAALQVQYGPLSICNTSPDDSYTYCLLSPEGDELTQDLLDNRISSFMKIRVFGRNLPFEPKWFLGQDV